MGFVEKQDDFLILLENQYSQQGSMRIAKNVYGM